MSLEEFREQQSVEFERIGEWCKVACIASQFKVQKKRERSQDLARERQQCRCEKLKEEGGLKVRLWVLQVDVILMCETLPCSADSKCSIE